MGWFLGKRAFSGKACPGLDPGCNLVFRSKVRQYENDEAVSVSNECEATLARWTFHSAPP
jgi:hypothetical protein